MNENTVKVMKFDDKDARELEHIVYMHIGCLQDWIEKLGEGAGEFGYNYRLDRAREVQKILRDQLYPSLKK